MYLLTTPVLVITKNEDFKLQKLGFKSRHEAQTVPASLPFNRYRNLFPGGHSNRAVKPTTHLHLRWSLRISVAIPLPPLYAIMAWIGIKHYF